MSFSHFLVVNKTYATWARITNASCSHLSPESFVYSPLLMWQGLLLLCQGVDLGILPKVSMD